MSDPERYATKAHRGNEAPPEEWEQYVRDNAVCLVRERDELIRRLREELTRLNNANSCLRRENAKLQAELATGKDGPR